MTATVNCYNCSRDVPQADAYLDADWWFCSDCVERIPCESCATPTPYCTSIAVDFTKRGLPPRERICPNCAQSTTNQN